MLNELMQEMELRIASIQTYPKHGSYIGNQCVEPILHIVYTATGFASHHIRIDYQHMAVVIFYIIIDIHYCTITKHVHGDKKTNRRL